MFSSFLLIVVGLCVFFALLGLISDHIVPGMIRVYKRLLLKLDKHIVKECKKYIMKR